MDFTATVQRQRTFFRTGATRSPGFRREQLRGFSAALDKHQSLLLDALQADLGKSPIQGYTSELGVVQTEIHHALRHLGKWAASASRRTPRVTLSPSDVASKAFFSMLPSTRKSSV